MTPKPQGVRLFAALAEFEIPELAEIVDRIAALEKFAEEWDTMWARRMAKLASLEGTAAAREAIGHLLELNPGLHDPAEEVADPAEREKRALSPRDHAAQQSYRGATRTWPPEQLGPKS